MSSNSISNQFRQIARPLRLVGLLAFVFAPTSLHAAPGDLRMTIPRPATSSAFFGNAVATVDGRILIGDPFASVDGVSAAGRAYLYDAKSGEMLFDFPDPNPFQGNFFGDAVAADGNQLLVGASGFPYVFDAKTGELQHGIRRPNIPEGATGGSFGEAVAIAGGKILVGAWSLRIDGITSVGGGYLFDAETADFMDYLPSPPPLTPANFGKVVTFMGDQPVVGAPSYRLSENLDNFGAVFVFDPASGEEVQRLENPDPLPFPRGSEFGEAVAARGDVIVVGAHLADSGGVASTGKAYVFNGRTGELVFRIPNPEPTWPDQFGFAVAWVGDNIMASSPEDEVDGHTFAGSVYLFDGQTGELLLTIPNPEPERGGLFGWSLAELDGDIVVGSRANQNVYIFEGLGNIVVGDTDADGDVDIDDLNRVRNHFGKVGPDDGTLLGDTFPYDGAVGIDDLNRIRNHFGRSSSTAVPEPGSAMLAVWGAVMLAAWRRFASGRASVAEGR